MFASTAFSKLSRIALVSVFCAGLFVASGELSMNPNGGVQMGNGGVAIASAAEPGKTEKKDVVGMVVGGMIDLANIVIKLLSIFLTPLIMLSGWLLSPDWTFGDIFGLRPILHKLWILISNVVYVVFGFMLVFVAFANIFGWEHAKAYEMKSMLPKLVTGMLMVPFTWFIVSATLSVANVLTISVIQLPISTINQAGSDKVKKYFNEEKMIPKDITLDLTQNADKNNMIQKAKCPEDGAEKCLSISEVLSDSNGGAYNLLSTYAYGIFHVQNYMDITKNQITEKTIKSVIDIVQKLGFGLIFFVVFGILVIAIVYALFTRAIMLWMYAIFSPLFALNYAIGGKHKSLEKLSIKEFISLAMVPVYVSAALAFGLMFLSLVMNKDGYGKVGMVAKIESTKQSGQQKFQIGGEKGMTLTTIGDPNTMDTLDASFGTGQGLIGSVIMGFLAIVILWMAVMAALGASKITEAAVKPIADMGNQVGSLAKSAPQYIPIPGMKWHSMASATQWVQQIARDVPNKATEKASEFAAPFVDKNYAENMKKWQTVTMSAAAWKWKETAEGMKVALEGKNVQGLALKEVDRRNIGKVAHSLGLHNIKENELNNPDKMAEALAEINKKLISNGNNGIFENSTGKDIGSINTQLGKIHGAPAATAQTASVNLNGAKAAGAEQTINININGANKAIKLESNTVLSKTKIELNGNDKTELAGIIKGKSESEAKALLKTIFKESEVDIDMLYSAIK